MYVLFDKNLPTHRCAQSGHFFDCFFFYQKIAGFFFFFLCFLMYAYIYSEENILFVGFTIRNNVMKRIINEKI